MSFDFPGEETFLVSCMIGFGFAWRIFLGGFERCRCSGAWSEGMQGAGGIYA